MGIHTKERTRAVTNVLARLGEVLGYVIGIEEPMHPGEVSTSFLDLTWRLHKSARYPLFVFEIESAATKSAADNALKVFSRRTSKFEKPLFFYHIFLDASYGAARIAYLNDNYDKLNYGAYLLDGSGDMRLLQEILEQHLRLRGIFDLYEVVELLENDRTLSADPPELFEFLRQRRYDHAPEADFLLHLEALIVHHGSDPIRKYYERYLPVYLDDKRRQRQLYSSAAARSYSRIIHYALFLLLNPTSPRQQAFEELLQIERSYSPWPLWEPNFGLSLDHDMVLLSEFPLILTLLSAAFRPRKEAVYFSQKLWEILREIHNYTHYNIHGLTWLLIASQISDDRDTYENARETINRNAGLPMEIVTAPSTNVDELPDRLQTGTSILIPPFELWRGWIMPYLTGSTPDVVLRMWMLTTVHA